MRKKREANCKKLSFYLRMIVLEIKHLFGKEKKKREREITLFIILNIKQRKLEKIIIFFFLIAYL